MQDANGRVAAAREPERQRRDGQRVGAAARREQEANAQRVRSALAALPPEQREPIELGFFGGVTHQEIARRSQTPLGTVKTRIRSGLRRLRAVLDEAVTV